MYPILLKAHMAFILISLLSFSLRTVWAVRESDKIDDPTYFKIHKALNLILIISGFALCIAVGQYPFIDAWVTEKLILLFVYVGFAMLAFRPNMNMKVRQVFIGLTVLFFVVIFYIAKTKVALFI